MLKTFRKNTVQSSNSKKESILDYHSVQEFPFSKHRISHSNKSFLNVSIFSCKLEIYTRWWLTATRRAKHTHTQTVL